MKRRPWEMRRGQLRDDPQWYKDAIIYELRVRSFMDSNGDGIGDFPGLTSKLDYLQDLGVSALWLLPICPSPGKDDGYDISDYTDVHPDVGTLDDFRLFVDEAHQRGLRVITELVLNHSSDQHPWFQRARRAPPGSPERNFYVWSDTPDRYRDARIIFKDFEPSNWSWDPIAKQYFWHRFYAHQPDLNFDNPAVHEAMLGVVDFWFGLGVDGLRLDAVPYLYEREGTNCENLPETHDFLKKLRAHVDSRFKNRLLLAEANQWPEDAARYYGNGDECHMNFHFPIMPRIFMSIHMEDRLPIMDILAQTPAIPANCQWALFLRNHDELTLEMVTDEERDYMYRAFAHEPTMRINLGIRRRLAPLVGNDRRQIELMNAMLLSLPGTPVLYYGDELGMGDNIFLGDRNGVRTPMQWAPDRNAGYSKANPQRLILPVIIDPEYHYESLNVEAQQGNPNSLLWWTKRLIALRKRFQAFGRGTIEFLAPENPKVLAFIRQHEDETVLVVVNLSRFTQYVELDLKQFKGRIPVELIGRTRFPPVGDLPYLLTLGEHAFYWFSVEQPEHAGVQAREASYHPPTLEVASAWEGAFSNAERAALEMVLPAWIEHRRWLHAGGREVSSAHILDVIVFDAVRVAVIQVDFSQGEPDQFVAPLSLVGGEKPPAPAGLIAILRRSDGTQLFLMDALFDPAAAASLLESMRTGRRSRGVLGMLRGSSRPGLPSGDPRLYRQEHHAASVQYGDALLLKFYRRLGEGMNPELEIGRALTERAAGAPIAPFWGALELWPRRGEPITISTLHGWVQNQGTAWHFFREEVRRYFERALALGREMKPPPRPATSPVDLAAMEEPPQARELFGSSLAAARLLGKRTAELHAALISDDPAFAPEPYSALDQRSVYQTKRNLTGKVLRQLRTMKLEGRLAELAQQLLAREKDLYARFEPLLGARLTAARGRIHGEYHLGNVLWTGKDFVVVDFNGNPERPLPERRRKRSALRDVAWMMRSFDSAASFTLRDPASVRESERGAAEPWARLWATWTPAAFLAAYLEAAKGSPLLPRSRAELSLLLDTLLLEKALDELSAELGRREDWAFAALRALLDLLG
ncbi:MAG: maltose alpha-D-glucosyltransferase [Deltaproteobacteria bacterium]|nr:MAG: maltose alpha-D-glucosyltransferase [Deltaproteobacteria bacterium]